MKKKKKKKKKNFHCIICICDSEINTYQPSMGMMLRLRSAAACHVPL